MNAPAPSSSTSPKNASATTIAAFPELALTADGTVLILPYQEALEQFVQFPISEDSDILPDEVCEDYDEDLLLSNVAVYDSIGGREGFRLRSELTEERYWKFVVAALL